MGEIKLGLGDYKLQRHSHYSGTRVLPSVDRQEPWPSVARASGFVREARNWEFKKCNSFFFESSKKKGSKIFLNPIKMTKIGFLGRFQVGGPYPVTSDSRRPNAPPPHCI